MTPQTRNRFTLALILGAAVIVVWWLFGSAWGHSWYSAACCSDRDCKPLPAGAVELTPGGWLIKETGETWPQEKTKPSMDLQFHRCSTATNKTRCLYVPGAGS